MIKDQQFHEVSHRERQFNRILVAIRQKEVFLYPPLAAFMFGKKPWSLNPTELAILSLLSEYGNPVVAEVLGMSIDMMEHYIATIYRKLEITEKLTAGSRN